VIYATFVFQSSTATELLNATMIHRHEYVCGLWIIAHDDVIFDGSGHDDYVESNATCNWIIAHDDDVVFDGFGCDNYVESNPMSLIVGSLL
jgi:hypothetical protein